jgi:CubicO group peptidase (beta-lactamase class C family)
MVCTLLCLFITGHSQTPSLQKSPPLTEETAGSAGFSPERLTRIDNMLKEAVASEEIPGAVALIVRNGKIVYYKAFGKADLKKDLSRDAIFRIASQSKAITATAVMMLWEEGKFQLDDPISDYIPEFKNATVLDSLIERDSSFIAHPADKPITIRHLLTHTSGIGYGVIDGDERMTKIYQKAGIIDLFTTTPMTIGENVKKLATLPLHHNPGERFTYSEGLDVLGYFIEIVSGMPLDKFFKTRIFDPLGMEDTWFYLPEDKSARLVPVFTKGENGEWAMLQTSAVYDPEFPVKGARSFFSGGAGLSSTAKDYAIFLQMYLNGGEYNGTRLLSRTTVQSIMGNHIKDLWGDGGSYYGLAFGVVDQKGQDQGGRGSVGTFDWGGYFNTQYFADPKEKVIGILMKQTSGVPGDDTGWKFRQLVFQSIDD